MRGLFHNKARRTAGTLVAAVSSLLISCASQRISTPAASPEAPVQRKVLAARVLKKRMPALSSVWEGGNCSFQDNSVSYYSYASRQTKTLKLDVKVRGSDLLLCSSAYTVLMSKDTAFVSIGGADILDGREWFGQIGDRFTWANSYELNLEPVIEKGGDTRLASLAGNKLCITGRKKAWAIDLGNPYEGWKPY